MIPQAAAILGIVILPAGLYRLAEPETRRLAHVVAIAYWAMLLVAWLVLPQFGHVPRWESDVIRIDEAGGLHRVYVGYVVAGTVVLRALPAMGVGVALASAARRRSRALLVAIALALPITLEAMTLMEFWKFTLQAAELWPRPAQFGTPVDVLLAEGASYLLGPLTAGVGAGIVAWWASSRQPPARPG